MSAKSSATHLVRKGLDLPIKGVVPDSITPASSPAFAAVILDDYVGVKPRLIVAEGDHVLCGQPLFEDRSNPGVYFTSPAAGTVSSINRGDRRALESVVISVDSLEEHFNFPSWTGGAGQAMSAAAIRAILLESGLWTAFRVRPFSRIPSADAAVCPIFVTAIDTYPLAPDPAVAIRSRQTRFEDGLRALKILAGQQPVYLCAADQISNAVDGVELHIFKGPHPAGLPGTHIHMISPASPAAPAWHIGYQDVIELGALLETGRLHNERVVSVSGPSVTAPVVWRTRVGAAVEPLVAGRLAEGENRVVAGSVIYGRAVADQATGYLGRFHNQITVLPEYRERHFLGWLAPGLHAFSVLPLYLANFLRPRRIDINTSMNGSPRAVMPFGALEKVMPLDIMPTFLARALMSGDADLAVELGALELDEEDLALCTLVCPGKNDYGPALRHVLEIIQKES